jgi:murein tripeptide amidase MpaA
VLNGDVTDAHVNGVVLKRPRRSCEKPKLIEGGVFGGRGVHICADDSSAPSPKIAQLSPDMNWVIQPHTATAPDVQNNRIECDKFINAHIEANGSVEARESTKLAFGVKGNQGVCHQRASRTIL